MTNPALPSSPADLTLTADHFHESDSASFTAKAMDGLARADSVRKDGESLALAEGLAFSCARDPTRGTSGGISRGGRRHL